MSSGSILIAAAAPKGIKGQGYNVSCTKCGTLLRASRDRGTKNYPQEEVVTYMCSPCYSKIKGGTRP